MTHRARGWAFAICTAVALGLFAEWASLRRPAFATITEGDYRAATADFAVGLILVGCGAAAGIRSESRTGPLLLAAGFAWYLGTFASSPVEPYASLGAAFVTLHRGPLAHAIFTHPRGRAASRLEWVAVAAAYACAAGGAIGSGTAATVAFAALLPAASLHKRRRAPQAVAAALVVALALALAEVSRWRVETARGYASWAYLVATAVAAALLAGDVLRRRTVGHALTKLVLDLGASDEPRTLAAALANVLGDPSLRVFYRLREPERWVDEFGRTVTPPAPSDSTLLTPVTDREGDEVAVLVHDPAALRDQRLVGPVATAVQIAVMNLRLRSQVEDQIEKLKTSQRRILRTADEQRRRLAEELERRPVRCLQTAVAALAAATPPPDLEAEWEDVRAEADSALEDLRRFAAGVHPITLTGGGLAEALDELRRRLPIPVTLALDGRRYAATVESAVYFVCSEALANVAKHARAASAALAVTHDGQTLCVEVRDDGVGGANLASGTGLSGLQDRIGALGGRLTVDSSSNGTCVRAELPLVEATSS